MFFNEKGVVHIAAIILVALVGFMFLPGLLKNNTGIDISGTGLSDEQKQTELIRQTAYKFIDMHSLVLKTQVDVAIELWESAPADQKERIKTEILDQVKDIKMPDFKNLVKN